MSSLFRQLIFPAREVNHFWIWVAGVLAMTIVFAFGTIYYPVPTNVFFAGLLLCAIIFFRLDVGILASIFFFFILFRLDLLILPKGQRYEEIIYIGSSALVVITYLVWQLRKFSKLSVGAGHNPISILLIFFIFWAAITLFWTTNLAHGFNMLFSMSINLLLVHMLCVFVQTPRSISSLLKLLTVLGAILGLLTITSKWYLYEYTFGYDNTPYNLIMAIGGDNLSLNSDNMRAGGFAPANHAAFGLNIFIFAILSSVFHSDTLKKKTGYLFIVMILIISLVLTGSKGGFGSMIIGMAFVLLTNPTIKDHRISWNIFFSFVIIVSIICALMMGEGRLSEAAKSGATSDMTNRSLSARITIWKNGFKESGDNLSLIVGYGLGASAKKAAILPHMHSFYFSTILDLGIIGMSLYLSIIFYAMKNLRQCIRSTSSRYIKNLLSCLAGALVSALINGLVMSEFTFPFFWILLGLIVAITTKSNYIDHKSFFSHEQLEDRGKICI